ncbi:MAG: LysM peptidoglycan-binding domain-containing protein [Deltaproteobacteria bacterium]|nr:LysM peptidoglycan-binding domain-containing protein [Deltaproteobacteria bacterium]
MKSRPAAFLAVVMLAAFLSIPGPAPAEEGATPAAGAAAYPDGLVYTVAEGDTLWDLSAKYLGSPWKWPELWEKNRFLTNPHYIYPGIRLVIFLPPGKEIALPMTGAPEEGAAGADVAGKPQATAAGRGAAVKPPTLAISPSEYVRAGEFVKEAQAGIGRIRGGDEPKVAYSDGDTVYMKLGKDIPSGQLLGVYRVRGPIDAPGDRPVSGYAVYLVGLIQSLGKKDGESAGIVRKSFEDLLREDILREEIPSYVPVVLSRVKGDKLEANIISGQWENEELADGNFIFLDRGAAAGVAVGDVFLVLDEWGRSLEGSAGAGTSVPVEVAEAVIVRVSRDFSTGYILKSRQSFSAGARAVRGGPGLR